MATVKCKVCNNEFEQSDPRQLYCSVKCRNKAAWQRHKNNEKCICKCKHCGKEFEQKDPRQIHCSEECRIEYKKAKSKRPKINYKKICPTCGNKFNTYDVRKKYCCDKCREKAKPSHNIKKEPKVLNKICPMCNKEFTTTDTKQIYCSTECRYKNSLTYHGEIFKKICQNCGKEFESKDMRTLYCSDDCQEKYHNEKRKNKTKDPLYICKYCGKKYKPPRESSNFCSHSCRTKFYNEKRKQEPPKFYDKVCAYCGKEFQAKSLNAKFCSKKCKIADYRKRNPDIHVDICEYCGKEIVRKAKKRAKHVFCCHQCAKDYYNQTREIMKCQRCGKEFIKQNKYHIFCSDECRMSVMFNKKGDGSYKRRVFENTKICQVITKYLREKNIDFTEEYRIGRFRLDILVLPDMLPIEINGSLWHTDHRKFNDISKCMYVIDKDKRKNEYVYDNLHKNTLYLWEIDINQNPQLCLKLVDKYISNHGVLDDYDSFNYCLNDNDELCLKDKTEKPYRSYTLKELDNILSLND